MTEDARGRIDDLFRRYAEGIGRYVRLRVGSAELAEEITGRVFLSVVRNIEQQNHSAVGWLWAIVRSELARHYRERSHRAYPAELESSDRKPVDEATRRESAGLLYEGLRSLPDDDQQLISLKYFLGLGNVEIAEMLSLTPSNVGVRLHRVLKELRRRLSPDLSPTLE